MHSLTPIEINISSQGHRRAVKVSTLFEAFKQSQQSNNPFKPFFLPIWLASLN